MWVDITDPRQFAGNERITQVCSRISVLHNWAERQDVPMVYSTSRHSACRHPAFNQLLSKGRFHASHHSWCRIGARVSSSVSAAQHKVFSSVQLPNQSCNCAPGTSHVYDLNDRSPGSAVQRAQAEQRVLASIITTLGEALDARLRSSNPSDPVCIPQEEASFSSTTNPHVCSICGLTQYGPGCQFCSDRDGGDAVQAFRTYSVTASHSLSASDQKPITPSSAEQTVYDQSYPTDSKLSQKQRKKEGKARGLPTPEPKRKPKKVEQHFDDCGEDLSSLCAPVYESWLSDSSESDSDKTSPAVQTLSLQANAFVMWSVCSGPAGHPPELAPGSFIAVDVDEMTSILGQPDYMSYGFEVVELAQQSHYLACLNVRRALRKGTAFELSAGLQVGDPVAERKVLEYVASAKPALVLIAPSHNPAPDSPFNRLSGWTAALQLEQGRTFLVEQCYPSSLYECPPWPKLRADQSCYRVVFHQCMLNPGLAQQSPSLLEARHWLP